MEQVDLLEKRLKELRRGPGLNDPGLWFAPDDPLCVAFGIGRTLAGDKRQKRVRSSLLWWIEEVEDVRWRESLQVALGLHSDYQEDQVEDRRDSYAPSIPVSVRTVKRDEDKAIQWLAERLAHELKSYFPLTGKKVHVGPNGVVYPLWLWRAMKVLIFFWLFLFINIIGVMFHLFYIVIEIPALGP